MNGAITQHHAQREKCHHVEKIVHGTRKLASQPERNRKSELPKNGSSHTANDPISFATSIDLLSWYPDNDPFSFHRYIVTCAGIICDLNIQPLRACDSCRFLAIEDLQADHISVICL